MRASTHAGFKSPPSPRAVVDSEALPFVAYSVLPSPGFPLLLEPYSFAVGVGHSRIASVRLLPGCILPVFVVPRAELRASDATAVGHEEEPLSPVRGADVGGGDDAAFHSIPEPDEAVRNSVQAARNEGRHVFDDHDSGPKLSDDSAELAPESGVLTFEPRAFARNGDVGAGEPSAHDVNRRELRFPNRSDIGKPRGRWPAHREHPATERIDFYLPRDGAEPGPFQAKLEPPDSREERTDRCGPHRSPDSRAW